MKAKVRVGAVSFLNAKPLVYGIEEGLGAGRIALSLHRPSELADLMAAGELDVGLLPSIELARIGDLVVAPGLAISTHGPAASVLLVSRRRLEEVESVALDPDSRTSNALTRVLFAEVWRSAPRCSVGPSDLADALRGHDAAVRIGDKALFEPLPEGAVATDLGEAWTGRTGLPFVFAVWAARPGVLDRELYELLHASRRRGSRMLEAIAAQYAWNGRRFPERSLEYLQRHIRYRLGAPEVESLRRFFAAARGAGVIEAAPEIRLASFSPAECGP